jgi:hypothetical protein
MKADDLKNFNIPLGPRVRIIKALIPYLSEGNNQPTPTPPPEPQYPSILEFLTPLFKGEELNKYCNLLNESNINFERLRLMKLDDLKNLNLSLGIRVKIVKALAPYQNDGILVSNTPTPPSAGTPTPPPPSQSQSIDLSPSSEQSDQSLQCPITCDYFIDPVMAADGTTYERAAITEWLKEHKISPLSGKMLAHKNLIPNIIVKNLVQERLKR